VEVLPYSTATVPLAIVPGTQGGWVTAEVLAQDPALGSEALASVGTASIEIAPPGKLEIEMPADNPYPDANPSRPYQPFVVKRAFSDTAVLDEIEAVAIAPTTTPASALAWTVISSDGGVQDVSAAMGSASYTFVPKPTPHPGYSPGNRTCPGDPRCEKSVPLSLDITVMDMESGQSHTHRMTQNEKDIIIQEFWNHGLPAPGAENLKEPVAAPPFEAVEFNHTAYRYILGTPGPIAVALLKRYNELLFDDIDLTGALPIGAQVEPNTVIIAAGADIADKGSVLDTPVCFGSPLPQCEAGVQGPACCDDQVVKGEVDIPVVDENGNVTTQTVTRKTITAGADGVIHTHLKRRGDVILPQNGKTIRISSRWRNPERNEVFSKVINSKHQSGNALDFTPLITGAAPNQQVVPVAGVSDAETLWCTIAQAADDLEGRGLIGFWQIEDTKGITVDSATGDPYNCKQMKVGWHIHAQR
jgi:hypothetical protein